MKKEKILIAGIGGASLGTEIAKSLSLADKYEIYGCDIAKLAYGHFMPIFKNTFLSDENDYVGSIVNICIDHNIKYVVPGGEKPMVILGKNNKSLRENNITLVSNSCNVIQNFSDKQKTFKILSELGFAVPKTREVFSKNDLSGFLFPVIIKPFVNSGGSDSVFLASTKDECMVYVDLLRKNGKKVIVQESLPIDEGEYTIGVLSLTNKKIVGTAIMKRIFISKLSILHKSKAGLISTGNSQGAIVCDKKLQKQAEKIAKAIDSRGPLNIQGRVKNGVLYPFEINPRFSASTFLRALSGFNEVDFFMDHLINGTNDFNYKIKEGVVLRSFEEVFIEKNNIKKL